MHQRAYAVVVAVAVLLAFASARAQSITTGAIRGVVTDVETKEPIIGVMVIVASPALLGTQMAATDEHGAFVIDNLPPGEYVVAFSHGKQQVVRPRVMVSINRMTSVYQKMSDETEKIPITEPPPDIDIGSAALTAKLNKSVLTMLPVPGGGYDGAALIAPGTRNDGAGVAVAGSSSLENRFFFDGLDTTGLQYGTIGTPMLVDFLDEVEVITGGYNAEYGRSTGGILNVVSKSGSNELHGQAFAYLTPGILVAARERTPTQISSIDARRDLAYSASFGADLGGPIVEDKAWFYVAVSPSFTRYDVLRRVTRRTDCRTATPDGGMSDCDRRPTSEGGFADGVPDVDPTTGFYITEELDRDTVAATGRALSALGKINVAIRPEHQGQLSLVAQPQDGIDQNPYGIVAHGAREYSALTTDLVGKWTSKFHDHATEIEAVAGWHRSTYENDAHDDALESQPAEILRTASLGVLGQLGGESLPTMDGCTDNSAGDPYPFITNCPDDGAGYHVGGPGALVRDREERRALRIGVIRRQRAFGGHEIKAGIDVEDNTLQRARLLSGGAFLDNYVGQGSIFATRWVQLAPAGATADRFDNTCRDTGTEAELGCDYLAGDPGAPGTTITGKTLNWAAYLRDSWQIRPDLVLTAGLRYEEQRLRYANELQGTTDVLTGRDLGKNAMVLNGMVAPRVGLIWDWTGEGRSKLYAHWGRYYESIPMQINDRSFGGEVQYRQRFQAFQCGEPGPAGFISGTGCLADENLRPGGEETLFGSSGVLVAPGLEAQYLDESLVGAELEIAADTKIGVTLQHRRLGRVIEDVSVDGAQTYIIANPGEWSAGAERDLEAEIMTTSDPDERARLERELAQFRGIRGFDKPRRDHTALQLVLSRRMARGLFAQASYTYARSRGNYPGLLSYDNGQVDPNISSQYDLIELLANRNGVLPQDRPHALKLDVAYVIGNAKAGDFTIGARLRGSSGEPVDALGPHGSYGADESFLLPRGAMGRTDFDHALDLHVGYGRKLGKGVSAEVFADLFNVYNHQGAFAVDETYAPNFPGNAVNPIAGGTYEDLIWAKQISDSGLESSAPAIRNPNFRNPTIRHAPFSARLGARARARADHSGIFSVTTGTLIVPPERHVATWIVRPTGVAETSHGSERWSTAVSPHWRTTSPARRPAFAAGDAAFTSVTSAPPGFGSASCAASSVVTGLTMMPSHERATMP